MFAIPEVTKVDAEKVFQAAWFLGITEANVAEKYFQSELSRTEKLLDFGNIETLMLVHPEWGNDTNKMRIKLSVRKEFLRAYLAALKNWSNHPISRRHDTNHGAWIVFMLCFDLILHKHYSLSVT